MITGLNTEETQDYTLKDDTENPTVWKLGVMSSYLFAKLSAGAQNNEIETAFKVLQLCLRGWDNFGEHKFATVAEDMFGQKVNVVPISLLEKLPITAVNELALKAMEINQLSVAEAKN